ncbi:membrane protein [Bacteroidales bacterium]|nr:membrane protein [Bacteroidales bacterium]
MYSQELVLNLNQTISLAGDSSLQAFTAKNLYLSSYWQFRTFKAGRLPSLSLEMTPLSYNRVFTKRYDSDQNIEVYRPQQSLYSSGNLSIRQNLDITGGTFFIDSELGYMKNYGENAYSQFSSVPIRIGYSQNLFGFNDFKWEKKIEPLKFEKAKRQFLFDKEFIAESSAQVFFDLAMAQTTFDMAKENLSSSDTLYKIGEERHKIASISQADVLTLKLDALNAKNALKNSEIGLERAMFSFVSFLNMDKKSIIRLQLPDRPQDLVLSVDKALYYARANNPSFIGSEQEILEAQRELDRANKASRFAASFNASVGFNQVASKLYDTYTNPLQQDIFTLGIRIPLVDWGVRKGKANMAKNNLNIAKISVQQKDLSLEQDVVMTVSDFNVQQDLIGSAEEALQLSISAYNITKQRFIIGKADINSLTLSLNRQNEAQKNYILALKNYWLSYYKIRKLTLFDFERHELLSQSFDEIFGL